eukprot:577376-Rhodomonas_salina.1
MLTNARLLGLFLSLCPLAFLLPSRISLVLAYFAHSRVFRSFSLVHAEMACSILNLHLSPPALRRVCRDRGGGGGRGSPHARAHA